MDSNQKMKANLLDKLIEKIMGGAFDPKEEKETPQEGELELSSLEEKPEDKEMDC